MSRLPFEKCRQILHLMIDGNSVRGIARLADVSPVTVLRNLELACASTSGGFARLTAAHSKKIDNHAHIVALYTVWYNFARINSAVKMAPATAAGISDRLWDVGDIVKLVECYEMKEAA